MNTNVNTASEPTGYTLVLPPGWVRIPLRSGTDASIRDVVKRTFANIPDDLPRDEVTKHRLQLERRLRELAGQAAENAGLDLYMPTALRGTVAVTGSFVVSEAKLRGGQDLDPSEVAMALASGQDSQRVRVDGAHGVRSTRLVPASEKRGTPFAARHVDYALAVPDDPGRWLTVAFSTPGDGNPEGEFADLLVELFDAIMTTFRWRYA